MCGILGIVAARGTAPSVGRLEVARMREHLAHRGPDGAGLWREENVILAHRRLAVLDPTPAGEQPMATPDGRYHLIYNGELYNDHELREELLAAGAVPGGFRSECDTETLLWAFATWGPAVFPRLRGMFAIAVYDSTEQVLHLARDPLGMKPLYFHRGARELTFASEPRAILAHPAIEALPDIVMVSAYLSTLHSCLGSRTLFQGIQTLEPGEQLCFDTRTGRVQVNSFRRPVPVDPGRHEPERCEREVRERLEDSLATHLRADVPVAAFLSGGLDSSILCDIASHRGVALDTWCAGGRDEESEEGEEDFEYARLAAAVIGARHREVEIDESRFLRDWSWMVDELGLPLSTPNEVAIHAMAGALRREGNVVAISGEGADELFAGYELAMQAAAAFCETPSDRRTGGRFQLEAASWVALGIKHHVLHREVLPAVEGDAFLIGEYDELFRRCEREAGPEASPLDAHLRFLRHGNLTALLRRLDSACMLASVEGRTPYADIAVAALADSLPMTAKLGELEPAGATAANRAVRGKLVLRRAWREHLPAAVIQRPKASFPLPFQRWVGKLAWKLETSPFARVFYSTAAREEVARDPVRHWQLAWPMLNLALWGDRWFS